jgi:hypothetical protein
MAERTLSLRTLGRQGCLQDGRPGPRLGGRSCRTLASCRDSAGPRAGAARRTASPATSQAGMTLAPPVPVSWTPIQSTVRPVWSGGRLASDEVARRVRFDRIA